MTLIEDRKPQRASGRLLNYRKNDQAYVIQEHECAHHHFDFRLVVNGVLKTWRFNKYPSLDPNISTIAIETADHVYDQRTLDGVITDDDCGIGRVSIWDHGTYELTSTHLDQAKAVEGNIRSGKITFIMYGQKLNGKFELVRDATLGHKTWLLRKLDDEFAAVGLSSSGAKSDGIGEGKKKFHYMRFLYHENQY